MLACFVLQWFDFGFRLHKAYGGLVGGEPLGRTGGCRLRPGPDSTDMVRAARDQTSVTSHDAHENQAGDAGRKPLWLQSAMTDLESFPDRLIQDSGDTFLRADNMTALLLAGGASIVMHNTDADQSIQDNVRHDRFFPDFWDKTLDIVGSPAFQLPVTGLWYALSAENRDDLNKERAMTMITALSVSGLVTTGLKAARDNDCPNGASWAWPSGHTASSFTVASVLDEFYGPEVGIPAYAMASLVAYRMVDTDGHWTSDVVFGATLGWVVGHTIAGKHKEFEVAGFKLEPFVSGTDKPVAGVSFVRRF
jgi:hypothetical protein